MSDDSARYRGFQGERLRWIEEAIVSTRRWIEEAGESASNELTFSRPGDFDYDVAIDNTHAIKAAEETLKALEVERQGIKTNEAVLQSDLDAGKYDDD